MTFGDFNIRPFALGAAVAIALEVGAAALTGSLASHSSASPTATTPTTLPTATATATATTVRGPVLTQPPVQTPTTRARSAAVTNSAPSPAVPTPGCTEMVAALPPPAVAADMQTCRADPAAFQACLGLDVRAKQALDAVKPDANNQWASCEQSHGVAKLP